MATQEQAASLRDKAAKCRRLANGMADDQTIAALRRLAESYDRQASEIEAGTARLDQQIAPKAAE